MNTRSRKTAGRILNSAYLEKCNKKQLLAIAKDFKLLVVADKRKQILASVQDQFRRRGILESQQENMSSGTGGPGAVMETEVEGASLVTPGGKFLNWGLLLQIPMYRMPKSESFPAMECLASYLPKTMLGAETIAESESAQ